MKRNVKKKKLKKSPLIATQERLNNFQTKFPYKFRQVFENYQKGQQELNQGDIHSAKKSFEKAISIYEEYIPAQNHLAVIFSMLDNYQEAFHKVKKVLTLDDKNVFALTQGAIFLYRLGKEKEASNFAKKAVTAFRERQGRDPYHDYDNLQKLVEMLSVLRKDSVLSELYETRSAHLAPMSLYRSALALSNEGFYEKAKLAFQNINANEAIKEKGDILINHLQLLIEEGLPVPLLYAEEDLGFEQLMAVASLYTGTEHEKQAAIEFLRVHYNSWSLEITKSLLKSKKLEEWTKKQLLSILAEWDEVQHPITIWLEGSWQQISLQPVELSLNEQLSDAFALANKNLIEGNITQAVSIFNEVREAAPNYLPVYLQLAEAYIMIKNFSKAESALKDAHNIAPLASVLLGFGKYYFASDEIAKAKDYLDRFDTRELEVIEDVYDAIRLKVKATLHVNGSEKALETLQAEKDKFQLVLNDWETFEETLNELFKTTSEVKEQQNSEQEDHDLHNLLESFTKDKLVMLAKVYKIRGYSKLNKNGLIELIVSEVYDKDLWQTGLSAKERAFIEGRKAKGEEISEVEINRYVIDQLYKK